jgi:hypothetical protein
MTWLLLTQQASMGRGSTSGLVALEPCRSHEVTDHEWPALILWRLGVSSQIMIDSWSTQGWMRYPDSGGLSEQVRA